jgi:pimeloyl-ACP methyl ester carboxylesterase
MKRALLFATLLLLPLLAGPVHGQPKPNRLDHTNLLLFQDASGNVHPVKSPADWQKRRDAVLQAMQEVMGPLPGKDRRCPLDMKVDDEVDCGNYVRRLISYASEPGQRVPAYLLVPKALLTGSGKSAPAILSLHPTNALGFKVTVGLAKYPNAEYGRELAERGYVVLATPYPLLSNYNPDLKALGYQSGTMKAIWDNIRGLDLLDSLPYVKKDRFAAIGHSLGGHNSVYTAAFDDRIKVVVSSCGLDSYRDYMGGKIKGWTSDRYMPRLLDYKLDDIPFDFHEIIGAIAPRHVLIVAPIGDTNFRYKSVDAVAKSAAEVYRLHDATKNLRVEHPDVGHEFPKDMRDEAYGVIDALLK